MMDYDHHKLRADREAQQLSRDALVERAGHAFSEPTLERLERGIGTKAMLCHVALALGKPVERYLGSSDAAHVTPIGGVWTAYFLEQDVTTNPYVRWERLTVAQNGKRLSGQYEGLGSDHPEGDWSGEGVVYDMEGTIVRDVAFGCYGVEGRDHPRGYGTFLIKFTREGWGEGFCTYAADDKRLGFSLNIWVKNDAPEFRFMVPQARKVLYARALFLTAPFSA